MARTRKRQNLAGQLREAINASGLTRYRICKDCEIDQGAVSRFMHGTAGLNLESAGRIAEYLGLELAPKQPAKASKRTTKRKGGK